ncbi:hypothetical protein Pmani_009770 [Petrolisthes manimaculis]|uniref:Uncharacterized protein n=1 Tax=Petrolisthes manimaculis TaxID=1843537 RepID=A0AAE1UGF8_9EUCA|nr:hypothetical protein Pmani_009770 [Petrolisthes manimaculis]
MTAAGLVCVPSEVPVTVCPATLDLTVQPTVRPIHDRYRPRFAVREDSVILNSNYEGKLFLMTPRIHQQGVVYKAVAEDGDLGLTCPLGPGRNTRCPCATTHYTIHHPLFRIHTTSGQVFVRTGVHLAPGGRYKALIVAANANTTGANGDIMVAWGGFPGLTDHLILNVIVQLPDTLNLLLFPPQNIVWALSNIIKLLASHGDQTDNNEVSRLPVTLDLVTKLGETYHSANTYTG